MSEFRMSSSFPKPVGKTYWPENGISWRFKDVQFRMRKYTERSFRLPGIKCSKICSKNKRVCEDAIWSLPYGYCAIRIIVVLKDLI